MPENILRQQISREVKRALSERGMSPHAAALLMGKDRKLIYRWINQEVTAPLDALAKFAAVVGPIQLEIGGKPEEAAPPDWAERLEAKVDQLSDRWTSHDAPPWAAGLTDQIVSAIEGDRQAVISAAIEAAVDVAERRLFEGSDPEPESPPTDPPRVTEEGQPRPEA